MRAEGLTEGAGDGSDVEGRPVGKPAETEGIAVRATDGKADGLFVGLDVGPLEGNTLGTDVGLDKGPLEGDTLGMGVGLVVGLAVGPLEGNVLGEGVGLLVGLLEGPLEENTLLGNVEETVVGTEEGVMEDAGEGPLVGAVIFVV